MSAPRLAWTPSGESTQVTLDFPHGLTRFQGLRDVDRALNVSIGGKVAAVVYDAFELYLVELRAVSRENDSTVFAKLTSWWAHAGRGGEFAFAMDATKTYDTTLSAAASQGDTSVSVTSTTGVSAGDWIVIEDADDPTKWERRKVSSVGTGSLTLTDAVTWSFANGSTIRHAEYFPKCVVLDAKTPFTEREGGQGVHIWDLRFRMRAVR